MEKNDSSVDKIGNDYALIASMFFFLFKLEAYYCIYDERHSLLNAIICR